MQWPYTDVVQIMDLVPIFVLSWGWEMGCEHLVNMILEKKQIPQIKGLEIRYRYITSLEDIYQVKFSGYASRSKVILP